MREFAPIIGFIYTAFTVISAGIYLSERNITLPVERFIGYTVWLIVYHALLVFLVVALLH
jgi:hypothetical protein